MFDLPQRSNLKLRRSRLGFVMISLDLLEVPVTDNIHEAKLRAWDRLMEGFLDRLTSVPEHDLMDEINRE